MEDFELNRQALRADHVNLADGQPWRIGMVLALLLVWHRDSDFDAHSWVPKQMFNRAIDNT